MVRGLCLGLMLALAAAAPLMRPQPRAETEPVPHSNDAADDPAVWVHPTDPGRSLILGTDKQGGLITYTIAGTQRQVVSPDCRPVNVDLLHQVMLGDSAADLALATVRAPHASGVKLWKIDPQSLNLTDVTSRAAGATSVIKVFDGGVPYGLCTYRSRRTGKAFFFVTDIRGRIEQYELGSAAPGLTAQRVRSLKVGSIAEGCVADDELGHLYVAEEKVGVWKFPAEPDGGDDGKLIARVGRHGLAADVEGLAIYPASRRRGYLIVSSQGNATLKVFERGGDNAFVTTIDPTRSERFDDVSDTDGIAVTNRPTSALFPRGLLVVQDGSNRGKSNQNFKLYAWEDVAAGKLVIDPDHMSISGR
jgi:3-phytase